MPSILTAIFNAFILVFCVFHVTASAQQVQISGMAPDYSGQQVFVYTAADPLSGKRVLMHHSETDAEGNFRLQFEQQEVKPIEIYINHVAGSMLAEPGNRYRVFFPPLDEEQVRSFSGTARVELVFADMPAKDLNIEVSNLNYEIDSFLVANVAVLGSRNFKYLFESFEEKLRRRYAVKQNNFLTQYLNATLGLTAYGSKVYTRRDFFEKYINPWPVTDHPAWVELNIAFFQQYFSRFGANYGPDLIRNALGTENSGEALLGMLRKDEQLHNDTLRQVIAIHALSEAFHADYPSSGVVSALEYLARSGNSAFVRTAAANTLDELTALSPGSPAPDFTFLDQYNEAVSLSDFRGKYVYLEFMAEWCTDCPREQSLIPAVLSEYRDIVEPLTVMVDSERESYRDYVARYPHYDWPVLLDETGFLSRDEYRLRSLPVYFLIDPEGNFVKAPARAPSNGIVEDLYPVMQKMKEQNRVKVGEK
jgi:thiol-disulfide isomerase/thioredoxin